MDESRLLDVQHSPLFKVKRKGLILAFFLYYFLCGLEYSITIPPAILNQPSDALHTKDFLFVEAGLYPLGALLTSSVFGHVYDRTKKIRSILLGLGYLQIVGNFIYAIEFSRGLSLFGRFVSGLGDGFIAASVAEITYLYEAPNRVGMFCFLEMGRLIGVLNGPVANYFITKWTRDHKWKVSDKTPPAYIMGCAWAIVTTVAFLSVHNMALDLIKNYNLNDSPFMRRKSIYETIHGNESDEENISNPPSDSEDPLIGMGYIDEAEVNAQAGSVDNTEEGTCEEPSELELPPTDPTVFHDEPLEEPPQAKPARPSIKERASSIKKRASQRYNQTRSQVSFKYEATRERIKDYSKELVHEAHVFHILNMEVALLMVIQFVLWYTQVSFLMFCSYIPLVEYEWTPEYVGAIYVIAVIVILGILIGMYFGRKFVSKYSVYLVILALAIIQVSLALLIYEEVPTSIASRSAVFICSAVLMVVSIPATLVPFKMLLTSLVRPGIQGTLQGISATVVRATLVMGVLLSDATVHNRQVYASIMTGICFVTLILLFLCNELIKGRQKENMMKISY